MLRHIARTVAQAALAGLMFALPLALLSFALPAPLLAQQAAEYRPDRVRALMTSIHGYTRAGLEAASTNVDEILMLLAGDPNEEMLVRRQAIKGLRLYPAGSVLSFIERETAAAPESLKRLYLSSAEGFARAYPDRVGALAGRYLEDGSVNVRFGALKLSEALHAAPAVRPMLEQRLARETDPALRAAIQNRLNAN